MDVDTFRALARSSPWLWRSARLTRTIVGRDDGERVRAWIRRPGLMRVEYLEPAGRRPYVVDERGRAGSGKAMLTAMSVVGKDDAVPGLAPPQWAPFTGPVSRPPQPEFMAPQDSRAPQPEWRPDGLVARRPSDFTIEYDDPMHVNYQWVAMLDPVELADGSDANPPAAPGPRPAGVEVLSVEEAERLGRPTLVATVRPSLAYDPRCACCALLYSEISVAIDQAEGAPRPEPMPVLAETFRVALDRGTGICVQLRDIGGDHDGAGFDVEIEEVDAVYPDETFMLGHDGRRRWMRRR